MILPGGCLDENRADDSIRAEDDSGYSANWTMSSRRIRSHHRDDVINGQVLLVKKPFSTIGDGWEVLLKPSTPEVGRHDLHSLPMLSRI